MAKLFRTGITLNGQRAQGAGDGTAATDLVTLQQLQAAVRGLSWKQAVRVATTGAITIATGLNSGDSIDGVTLADGDRVLVKDQSTGSQNGIYVVAASPARAVDADSSAEIDSMAVYVEQGTVNADRMYVLTTDNPTLDTTSLTYAQLGGGGTTYTAGAGLTESPAGTFNVGAGTGITVNADDVQIATAYQKKLYAANCVATTNPQTFAHGLGTGDLAVVVKRVSDGVYVECDIDADSTNIHVDWGSAPSAGEYRVIAVG